MPVDIVDYRILDSLLDQLDQQAGGRDTDSPQNRACVRRPFRVGCKIYYYRPGCSVLMDTKGRTRNLSRNGVALIVRRMFNRGEVIELEIEVPERPKMYLAGEVVFCRYAGQAHHEVGISLRSAGCKPFFSREDVSKPAIVERQR